LKPLTTPRALAGIAGKIVSTSPAIMPAALYSRSLFQADQGEGVIGSDISESSRGMGHSRVLVNKRGKVKRKELVA
jgi:hypothetical protein